MRTSILVFVCFGLFLSVSSFGQQLPPSIVWQKCLGGSLDDKANAIIRTADNGFLIVGSSKSNDGDVTGHHGPTTSTDAWIVKLSAIGNLEWQKSMGGDGDDAFNGVMITSDGGYLCLGSTNSSNGDISGNHGGSDLWLIKLDRNGGVVWNKCVGGTGNETAGTIKKSSDNRVLIIGSTTSNDGDVSGNHSSASDIWVIKVDPSNGSLIWQQCYGGSNQDYGYDIEEADLGKIIMTVEILSSDGDFPPVILNTPIGRIIKTDSVRSFFWQQYFSRLQTVGILKTAVNEYTYACNTLSCYPGNPNSGIQMGGIRNIPGSPQTLTSGIVGNYSWCNITISSPSLAYKITNSNAILNLNYNDQVIAASSDDSTHNQGAKGKIDGWINWFKAENGSQWKKLYGGSQNDYFTCIAGDEYEFVAAGYTNSNDGDVSGNHGGNDIWVIKLGKTNTIKGTVYLDYNANGTKDSNEPFANNIVVESKKDTIKAASITNNGYFRNAVDTGNYSTTVKSNILYYTLVPASSNSSFTTYNNSDSLSFALRPIPNKKDYRIDLLPLTAPRPGFDMQYRIQVFNVGTDTLQNRSVRFLKDHRLAFVSANPVQASVSNDTITWIINRLTPRDTTTILVDLKIAVPPVFTINDTLISSASIDSTGDLTPSNNLSIVRLRGLGSIDPNDKSAANAGFMYREDILAGKNISYTIRFQNTGTDTAFNIVIKDTLDSKLDSTSIEMLQASHPYQLSITNGKNLTWTFNNILLPDSGRNESRSHGVISYRINPKSNVVVGDTIKNVAHIYFDFNPPIKTNTHETVIKSAPAVPSPIITGVLPEYCDNQGIESGKLSNLPSPNSGITTRVTLDTDILPVAADSTFSFYASFTPLGLHQLKVIYSNTYYADTVIMNIAIRPSLTPNVNVNANITNIISLANPVVVTAINAAGGGNSPLYTFALDKTFTTILQAEGSSNTLTLNPSNLLIGDNWIYVRMKTSLTCYTSQTNIDSILLKRDAVTGIIDVDDPGRIINIYPNPFNRQINIKGLNPVKNYEITIAGIDGKLLLQRQIQNTSQFNMPLRNYSAGIYFLNLYDMKKQKLIGSVRMVRE